MYIYNYFIILLDVCVSYDIRFDTIHDTKKKNSIYNMIHDSTTMHTHKESGPRGQTKDSSRA